MIEVHSRVQTRGDRAGDPLDGLVNMFDVGIVLAVAFLIAALQSHNLTQVLTQKPTPQAKPATHSIVVKPSEQVQKMKAGSKRVTVKDAGSLGRVYQLPNGQLVYVAKKK
jgi:hypothetical protein